MKKIKDPLILGLVAGTLAAIPKTLMNEILYRTGLETKRYAEVVSGVFLRQAAAKSRPGAGYGLFFDFIISSGMGVPLVTILRKTGTDEGLLKGGLTGLIGFTVLRGIMANFGPGLNYPKDSNSNIAMSLSSFLWGITASAIAMSIADRSVLEGQSQTPETPVFSTTPVVNRIP